MNIETLIKNLDVDDWRKIFLLLRHKGNTMDTPSLKRNLMFKLLQDNLGQFTTRIFVDDVQENLDAIKQTFPEFVVVNAETLRSEN